jgi:hypothetical protein
MFITAVLVLLVVGSRFGGEGKVGLCDMCTCVRGVASCWAKSYQEFPPLLAKDKLLLGTLAKFIPSYRLANRELPMDYRQFFHPGLIEFTTSQKLTIEQSFTTMTTMTTSMTTTTTDNNIGLMDLLQTIFQVLGYCLSIAGVVFGYLMRRKINRIWRYVQQRDEIRYFLLFF